ncbi:hypothetical protein K9M47_02170 [Candidatus Gracilibacteria bacterium]|nr:hypothetical protein [Candidatus Gracilibacteria bacterium]
MRNLSITFIFLLTSLISLTIFVGVSKVNDVPKLEIITPHMYDNEERSIETINLSIMYFVPKDRTDRIKDNWQEAAIYKLKELQDFHQTQFRGTSIIDYKLLNEIVIGEKNAKEYEDYFGYDDKDSLVPVKNEITKRILTLDGDLYNKSISEIKPGERKVYLVIFEGVGAAGNENFSLISRSYLTDSMHKDNGSTFLAHEFYHTLGLPDNYKTSMKVYEDNQQEKISIPTKLDIMGQVNIPIFDTYIDNEILNKMGL